MKVVTIKRIAMNTESTLGVILDEKVPFALTLERPWLGNQKSISCIPKGEYLVKRTVTPKHGKTWEVMDVPNRTAILIHKGNFVNHSEGCILLGEQYEDVLNSTADKVVTSVQASGKALMELEARMVGQSEFKLIIMEC